jgi:hypothetical protein
MGEEDADLAPLIERLVGTDAAARDAATATLRLKGADAVPALQAALARTEDAEARKRIADLLDELDWPAAGALHGGLRLTLKLTKATIAPGDDVAAKVRLANETNKPQAVSVQTEKPPGAGDLPRALRLVVIDAAGHHRAIGAFRNLNRGPDTLAITVAANSTTTSDVHAKAGCTLTKGNREETLPPGEYKVYAILGDPLGGWGRLVPPPLRSNEVRLTIARPKPDGPAKPRPADSD